jgi:hypothetical protein
LLRRDGHSKDTDENGATQKHNQVSESDLQKVADLTR